MITKQPLLDHKYIKPKSIHDKDVVDQFHQSYMYLACIHFINSVKTTASLRWHSPMLDDISACKTWAKVNQGMIKMYKAEVLAKLPIMQHFMFGSLISFADMHLILWNTSIVPQIDGGINTPAVRGSLKSRIRTSDIIPVSVVFI